MFAGVISPGVLGLPNLLCGAQGGTAREASDVLAASEDPGTGQGKVLSMPLRLHLEGTLLK